MEEEDRVVGSSYWGDLRAALITAGGAWVGTWLHGDTASWVVVGSTFVVSFLHMRTLSLTDELALVRYRLHELEDRLAGADRELTRRVAVLEHYSAEQRSEVLRSKLPPLPRAE